MGEGVAGSPRDAAAGPGVVTAVPAHPSRRMQVEQCRVILPVMNVSATCPAINGGRCTAAWLVLPCGRCRRRRRQQVRV